MPDDAKESRRKTTQALENLLLQTARDIRLQQQELKLKFPRMVSLPPPLQVNPDIIEEFTRSSVYREALDDYIQGRTRENVVVAVLRLLRPLAPMLFRGL